MAILESAAVPKVRAHHLPDYLGVLQSDVFDESTAPARSSSKEGNDVRTIEVIRLHPPELGTCRAPDCHRAIEWVVTMKGRRMPVDHPLRVEREHLRDDGTLITIIESASSHFVTCPAASTFQRSRR